MLFFVPAEVPEGSWFRPCWVHYSVLPVQRGNVSMSNLQVLDAILYVAEHGCKWRGLPARFGNWHTIYTRIYPDESMVEKRGSRPSLRTPAAGADPAHQAGGVIDRQHRGQGSSRWDRRLN